MHEDTIAAISTNSGEGGIGIIRISGEESYAILKKIFRPAKASEIQNRKLSYGHIIDEEGKVIDEVLACYMQAPHTYTVEDVVEINCHGSIVSLRKILALVLRKGARLAEAGEFTKRAFLNGRLDLSQAEAVMDLIKAKTDKSFSLAMSQLEGGFSSRIREIRTKLRDILVNTTVNIDYPDEDIEELTYKKLLQDITSISGLIDELLASAGSGRIFRDGLSVSIIGKPNVGKSSLMNALLRETRAIVTEIPGTTRDTIEEFISIRGIPVKLTDTAGIRETDDTIEKIGIEKSKEAFNKADLIIFMLDGSKDLEAEDKEIIDIIGKRKHIVLLNKRDLGGKLTKEELLKLLPNAKVIETSMKQASGIDEIESEIEKLVYTGDIKQEESTLVTNIRHEELLRKARKSLEDAKESSEMGEALDIIEIDLKDAYSFLGEIVGETVSDDIINEVFSRFCLGK